MAELVGLITGIGSMIAMAIKISATMFTIADELSTAGAQIRAIATDTRAMALVLHNLKAILKRDMRKINIEAKEVLKASMDLCATEMQNMDKHLKPLCGSGEGQKMDLKQKAMWLFAKTKISTTKASLDSMKLTLGLLLGTLEYMEGGDAEEIVEENIHQMISTTKTTKDKFLKAQRVDMAREIFYERSTNLQQTPEENHNNLPSPSSTLVEPAQVDLHLEYVANREPTSTSMRGDGNEDAHVAAVAQDHERQDTGENIDAAHSLAAAIRDPGLLDDVNQENHLAVMKHYSKVPGHNNNEASMKATTYLNDMNPNDDDHGTRLTDRYEPHHDSQDIEQVNRVSDWTLIRLLSDDSFLQIADHVRLQKNVSGFALDTMTEIHNAESTTPKIDEPAPSGPEPSYRAPTVESEGEEQDSDQARQLPSHINKEVSSQPPGSLPHDLDDVDFSWSAPSTNTSQWDLTRWQSASDIGSLAGWPGYSINENIHGARGHPGVYDEHLHDGLPQLKLHRRPPRLGKKPPSSDFYVMEPGTHRRQKYKHPFTADIDFGSYTPPHQGSGAGPFEYNPFGPFTDPAPQALWGYPAGVAGSGPNYPLPRYNWDYQTPPPLSFTNGGRSSPKSRSQPDLELEKVKVQIEALADERERAAQARERAEAERRIREDAEREFNLKARMEAMRQAQEEAKKEIESARISAEQAARDRIEEGRKAEEMRRKELESVRVRAELEFRQKMEQAAMEKKQRQGFMKYFKRS